MKNSFGSKATLNVGGQSYTYFSLRKLEREGLVHLSRMPFSIRVLLENMLRNEDGYLVTAEDVKKIASYDAKNVTPQEIPYMPARVVLQDFTGVPAVVDLAAMRDAMNHFKGDPAKINPIVRSDLVIDHSVQVDVFGIPEAFVINAEKEFERNRERYTLLRWAQKGFKNFSVVPPDTGIIHQINLEYFANVVLTGSLNGETVAYPDTLVGTDSHTTMINGLSVLGWGVGGIEAEAVMLGQPYYMLIPEVIGVKLFGELQDGATATDLVLTVTEMLRKRGVVGKFVEYFGPGLKKLSLADRATLSNMAPEYGATMGFFPVDDATLQYLRLTARSEEVIQLVEAYTKEQGLFRTQEDPDPEFTDVLELDMGTVEPSIAGPKRPQDRILLKEIKPKFYQTLSAPINERGFALSESEQKKSVPITLNGETFELKNGSVVIAAITSCTNTSNPSVVLAAGLVAKKAVEKGLMSKPWVKTSLAPGSRVVTDYLKEAGLMGYLEKLKFHLVGYGCTTCIGNSGPLPEAVEEGIKKGDLVACSVLSGNRNFEGRVHAAVKANYLASPPLVVAYALAGKIDMDFEKEPVGVDKDGNPVYLKDIWPSQKEIFEAMEAAIKPDMFEKEYGSVYEGNEHWKSLPLLESEMYQWDEKSTYIKNPPFFDEMPLDVPPLQDVKGARVLALLGDSVTTDHISPAGSIPVDGPAGKYLIAHGVQPKDFNSFGSRRGNHEVMMRGTFANIRIKNQLVPGTEGGWTIYFPTGEKMFIYDAAMKYQQDGTPLLVIGGKEYGTGSSRDWAAKGTALLGVKAVLAESFERIHRSNLIGMGVLPLQFKAGENRDTLGLTGKEVYDITGIAEGLKPGQDVTVTATAEDGSVKSFKVLVRLDTPVEVDYYQNGGILQTVLRNMISHRK
ncbi:MAG: aconitate hydratase AcnA [Calditrichaeota bacterium]|nr:aconitate hydratase AcnA [Calditrichota bacterium]